MNAITRWTRLAIILASSALAAPALAVAPPGSYRNSCINAYMDGNDLVATCRTFQGDEVESVLPNARSCSGDISNQNGQLTCRRSGGWVPPGGPDRDEDEEAPDGSYQESCRSIEVNGTTLSAECRNQFGRFRYTELPNYHRCRGDISNQNGVLSCPTPRQAVLPFGSWRDSCTNARVSGGILYADCRKYNGSFRPTQIPVNACGNAGIKNVNGTLMCEGDTSYAPPPPPLPPVPVPPYQPQPAITLFTDARYRGHKRTFTQDEPDLAAFNWANVASSLHVSGVWQLCSGPRYTGQCVTVSQSSPNLSGSFNDMARSLRRVR